MMKKEHLTTEPYKGVRDFYPEEYAILLSVFETIRTTLRLYGYEEYNASPLERAELYEAKTSEEIVSEQTYTFVDRGDRRVTLRPEMTPTLARMVAGKRRELVFPLRWFSIGNRFRYERPQKGRLREFYQTDIDILGLPEGVADIEVIELAHRILGAFGATEHMSSIRINSRTLLNAVCSSAGFSLEQTRAYIRLLDKKNKISTDEYDSLLSDITPKGDPLVALDEHPDVLVQEEYQKIQEILKKLSLRGVTNAVFDPSITRGFDYYTGLVFEIFDTHPDNPRALFGGGRYDNLIGLFGGEQIPAIGFALGDVTLIDFLATHNLLPRRNTGAEVYIGVLEDNISLAQEFAERLRSEGISVLVGTPGRSLGKQIQEADKRHIPFFIAYGETEATSGTVLIKSLREENEERIDEHLVAKRLREHSK